MATGKLSATLVDKAKPREKEYFLGDGNGLYLRVRPEGSKSWILRYQFNKKPHKMGLGVFGLTGVSLGGARKAAKQAHDDLAQGKDPKRAREEREADEEARREAETRRMTVRQMAALWFERGLGGRKDQGAEARRSLEKDILPALGDVPVEALTRKQVAEALSGVAKRAPAVARELLGDLRQMFGFGVRNDYIENDPTMHLKKDDYGRKAPRVRELSGEIPQLARLLPGSGLKAASQAAIWIMLSTCCRVGEVIQARWEHVDLEAGTWRIPIENSKNRKEHTVYLSAFAQRHFQTLRNLSAGSLWVLPDSQKGGHVDLKSLAKQITDRQRQEREPMRRRSRGTGTLMLPRGQWKPHDLRRTGATLMGELGVREDVINRCLNHAQKTLDRSYLLHEIRGMQEDAWKRLGERLGTLAEPLDIP
jgi:integrase